MAPLSALAVRLDEALPQTQCTRCGFLDCAAYAQAIASGEAPINQCPPGGMEGIARLSALTGQPAQALNPAHGFERPRGVAVIDETWCIGCTLCIAACPTDAIMACPVDCIRMENVSGDRTGWDAWSHAESDTARDRYAFHTFKQCRDAEENQLRLERKAEMKLADLAGHSQHTDPEILDSKRRIIEAALARARAKRPARGPEST
jgi:electron transport complex protein RnfB